MAREDVTPHNVCETAREFIMCVKEWVPDLLIDSPKTCDLGS